MQKMKRLFVIALIAGSMNTHSEMPQPEEVLINVLKKCNTSSNKDTFVPCLAQGAAHALNDFVQNVLNEKDAKDFLESKETQKAMSTTLKDQQTALKDMIQDLEAALAIEDDEEAKQIIQNRLNIYIKISAELDRSINILE